MEIERSMHQTAISPKQLLQFERVELYRWNLLRGLSQSEFLSEQTIAATAVSLLYNCIIFIII